MFVVENGEKKMKFLLGQDVQMTTSLTSDDQSDFSRNPFASCFFRKTEPVVSFSSEKDYTSGFAFGEFRDSVVVSPWQGPDKIICINVRK